MIAFFPKTGRRYYYLMSGDKVKEATWKGSDTDFDRLKIGNVFPTVQRALGSGLEIEEETRR